MTSPLQDRATGLGLQIRIAAGLLVLAGLWLIVSPWIFGTGYRHGVLVNHPIVGIIVVLLAASRFAGSPTMTWPSWASAPFGVWTLISPWVYGFTSGSPALEHDTVALGLIIIVLSVWGALAGEEVVDRARASFG